MVTDQSEFETGVTNRRKLNLIPHQDYNFQYLGESVEIAGAHRETRVKEAVGHSSLGRGGPLCYPDKTRVVVIVTEDGNRIEMKEEAWERMHEDMGLTHP